MNILQQQPILASLIKNSDIKSVTNLFTLNKFFRNCSHEPFFWEDFIKNILKGEQFLKNMGFTVNISYLMLERVTDLGCNSPSAHAFWTAAFNINLLTRVPNVVNRTIMINNTVVLQLLIDKGFPLNNSLECPLKLAILNGNIDMVKMLLDAGIKDDYLLFDAIHSDNLEIVKLLIERGVDVNLKKRFNHETPLMWAHNDSENGMQIAELLINSGANINAVDIDGDTALSIGVINEKPNIVKLLLEHGANVNVQDNNGETCMMKLYFGSISTKILEILLDNGGDPNIKNNNGINIFNKDFWSDVPMVQDLKNSCTPDNPTGKGWRWQKS